MKNQCSIAIIGTHGTGKTSLAQYFKSKHPEFFYIKEIARTIGIHEIQSYNVYDILNVQIDMIKIQQTIEKYHPKFISDRSVLDMGIYSENQELIYKALNYCIYNYDYIFYIPIMFPVVSDGYRNTDEKYRQHIDNLFKANLPIDTITIQIDGIINRYNEMMKHIKG